MVLLLSVRFGQRSDYCGRQVEPKQVMYRALYGVGWLNSFEDLAVSCNCGTGTLQWLPSLPSLLRNLRIMGSTYSISSINRSIYKVVAPRLPEYPYEPAQLPRVTRSSTKQSTFHLTGDPLTTESSQMSTYGYLAHLHSGVACAIMFCFFSYSHLHHVHTCDENNDE
jgi:hypothetical protein